MGGREKVDKVTILFYIPGHSQDSRSHPEINSRIVQAKVFEKREFYRQTKNIINGPETKDLSVLCRPMPMHGH